MAADTRTNGTVASPAADEPQQARGDQSIVRMPPLNRYRGPLRAIAPHSPTERPVLWILSIIGAGLTWEFMARVIVDAPLFFPPLTRTLEAGWELYVTERTIYPHMLATGITLAIGMLLSLIAIPIGLLIGTSRVFTILAEPVMTALYALPRIALVPVAIVWFGLGLESKVFIVFLGSFFMILLTVIAGAATVDNELRDVARSFRISRVRTFFTITVPGTVPFIFTGVRLGIGRALVGIVAAELFAASAGIGYLLGIYGSQLRTAELFVLLGTFAVAGTLLTIPVDVMARRFDRWRVV